MKNPYRVAFFVGFAFVQAVAQLSGGRLACRAAGHDLSWTLGDACGYDGPICKRCLKSL